MNSLYLSRRTYALAAVMGLLLATVFALRATAANAAGAAWAVRAVTEPSAFSPSDKIECDEGNCDRYQLLVTNIGDGAATGAVTLNLQLPPQLSVNNIESGEGPEGALWSCSPVTGGLTCSLAENVPSGGYAPFLDIRVNPVASGVPGPLNAEFSAEGGGGTPANTRLQTQIVASGAAPFGPTQFKFEPTSASGGVETQAGGHPWQLTSTFSVVTSFSPRAPETLGKNNFVPVNNVKNAVVELPIGMVGNPQATPHCTATQLQEAQCPAGSRIGEYAVIGGAFEFGEFVHTGQFCCTAVYNMVPEHGYPAEFAFKFAGPAVTLYASVIRGPGGYRIRAATTGLPVELELTTASITFFGDPAAANEEVPGAALLTNPAVCSGKPITSKLVLQPWEAPQSSAVAETTAYPAMTGCGALHFEPAFGFHPSAGAEQGTTQADAPSAYTADLEIPQTTGYEQTATPPLRDATVTLPAGVSVSPSAAQGLVGCAASGPNGINLGSDEVAPNGQDLGDPEATELGAGHAGGNGSPYDDGLYHSAPGHCPDASALGSVEVFTPVLADGPGGTAPLTGRVYLAQPRCGGAGQPACTEASATNGELFGLYVEAAGSGVIVKLAGSVSADPSSGQLQASFKDNPQFPFSHLRFHFRGGPRAPLANPQSCGDYAASSLFTSWGGQEVPVASPKFAVDWNGAGGPCPGSNPFAPNIVTGTTNTAAGSFTSFVLGVTRQDREQDLTGISEALPPGLLARITGVPLCAEADANAGSCGAESQIGIASAGAGPGSAPITIAGGRVYLTGPYKGAPYGLSIVQPAVAGPFNLGNVVVRAAIHVDPSTAAITVTSDPIPQMRDGVPFRLRALNIEISRSGGFTFNPTNCASHPIVTTVTGSQGASTQVVSPFAVSGCSGLAFHPKLSVSTSGKTSKLNGASLTVMVSQQPGEANVQRVNLQIPSSLPSRLSTLNHACTSQQFELNPAGCPEASVIGRGTAVTPALPTPLTGPAYIVSHGGQAFPDVEFVLQNGGPSGVVVVLDGKTQIKHGITYSRFETVPDAPITMFEATLPEGPHSILAANGNLCARTKVVIVRKRVKRRVHGKTIHIVESHKRIVSTALVIPATVVGQNGAQINQKLNVAITDCPRSKKSSSPPHSVSKRRGSKHH